MTTAIGIKGYDPILKKSYILLASDSKWTNKQERDFGFDAIKIVYNKNANMILAHAGTALFNSDNKFYKDTIKKINNLENKNYSKNEEIFKDLNQINKDAKCAFLFASNINSNLSLNYVRKKDFKILNKKLFKKNINKDIISGFIGSGHKFADGEIKKTLNLLPRTNDNEYEIKLSNLLQLINKGLIESSRNDINTNGHIDIGVLQNNGYMKVRNFSNLHEYEDFQTSKDRIIQKIRTQTGTTKKSLDKILLNI